jgi:hypothetical protein
MRYSTRSDSFYLVGGRYGRRFAGTGGGRLLHVRTKQPCMLDGASVATSSGNQLAVTHSLTFDPSYAGLKSLSAITYDAGGLNSDWQNIGAWTVTSQ